MRRTSGRSEAEPNAALLTRTVGKELTFGSISALFGLTHGIVDQTQYSLLIAAVPWCRRSCGDKRMTPSRILAAHAVRSVLVVRQR